MRFDEDRRVGDGGRGGHCGVFGAVLLSKKLFQTGPWVSQFSFQERWGWTFLFLLSTQLRYEKNMRIVVLKGPLHLFDTCRLVLFLAYCAKGSNRSNFPWIWLPRWPRWEIATYLYGACKRVAEFLTLPSRRCSASGVLEYLLRFHSLTPERVPVFQVPSFFKNIGKVKRKFHEVIVGIRCGPTRREVPAQFAVRKAGSRRWLRFFNVKQALRDVHSEEFVDWEVEQFADALVLRSLRAVPGVWRLPVWGQADHINAECFSVLGLWSFQTRIPQGTHTQLYGTLCGVLESIHQVRAPPGQWAELEVLLKKAVGGGCGHPCGRS